MSRRASLGMPRNRSLTPLRDISIVPPLICLTWRMRNSTPISPSIWSSSSHATALAPASLRLIVASWVLMSPVRMRDMPAAWSFSRLAAMPREIRALPSWPASLSACASPTSCRATGSASRPAWRATASGVGAHGLTPRMLPAGRMK